MGYKCMNRKPPVHFISSLWVNFALCCHTPYTGYRNDQPLQINQNNHLSAQVQTTACLVTEKKISPHACRALLTADAPFLAAKLVATSPSFPFSYTPLPSTADKLF